ncbi:MAG TPA: class I SAM-dependent methyltransferase [Lysobacter sp.]
MDVATFYERHPYPRPVEDLDQYRLRWQDGMRRRADYHLHWPHRPYAEDRTILVAGCGTAQAAKHAIRWPRARVVGIDFSETSVRHTQLLKRKYGLDNLEVHQLPIERVESLGARFDQIVCTGVLHHLPDPDAGLAALHGVLDARGAMQIMVYAPYGRTGIYMLQEFCRRLGVEATGQGIQELIATLIALPRGHPLEGLLQHAPDFREQAALADALLNPIDRAYSVPQFLDFIERAGLVFARWVRQAPYSPRCGALATIPLAERLRSLAPAEQYAVAELFRGTMLRHSAVVYSGQNPGSQQTLRFDGDQGDWHRYVPILAPDTIRVHENLPPGVAAVLINRTHGYGDLVSSVNAEELAIVDAIDGTRTLGGLSGRWSPSRVRPLMERLWWCDQVLIDASATARARPGRAS